MAEVEVSEEIDAPAQTVWDLIADLPRMGEWSPETTRVVWRKGATGAAAGARFRGYNRLGVYRWFTDGTVVTADAPTDLAFDISSFGLPVARWSYRIEALGDDRCRVTEGWDDRRGGLIRTIGSIGTGVRDRGDHNRDGMAQTLARLKAVAESPS